NKYRKHVIGALFGIIFIASEMTPSSKAQATENKNVVIENKIVEEVSEKQEVIKLSSQEKFEKKVKQQKNFVSLDKPFEDTYILNLKLESNYSKKAMIDATAITVTDLLSFISKNEELKNEIEMITINFITKFVNNYGNETEEVAVSYFFTKDKINKINFDNFNWKNLPKVADSYYVHPGAR
ncbi:hypothetical protein, partial [Cetobacterium sp.]|uniref:hypothetical protein n=1 Tax=Cetobacterium sp. TaxID=2071632 RepID=UPI003EE58FE3